MSYSSKMVMFHGVQFLGNQFGSSQGFHHVKRSEPARKRISQTSKIKHIKHIKSSYFCPLTAYILPSGNINKFFLRPTVLVKSNFLPFPSCFCCINSCLPSIFLAVLATSQLLVFNAPKLGGFTRRNPNSQGCSIRVVNWLNDLNF